MAKPYDSVFKDLLERDPAAWVQLALGPVQGRPSLVDADISAISGAADKVVLPLERPDPLVLHFEAFARWDSTLPPRALQYNSSLHNRHRLPVLTIMVVLRREADHPSLRGEYMTTAPVLHKRHLLEYVTLRAWELDVEAVLGGPLAVLPLAPITDTAAGRLPEVLRRMEERLSAEASPEQQKDLWTDTFILSGLRYKRDSVAQLYGRVRAMRESDTFQAILDEGREEGREQGRLQEAVLALLLVGASRLGEPNESLRQRLQSEPSLARVEEWLRHVALVESWLELPGL